MFAHLHTNERAPVAYIRYLFYKEFGWTPAEVRAIPLPELQDLMTVMGAVAKYQNRPKPKKVTNS